MSERFEIRIYKIQSDINALLRDFFLNSIGGGYYCPRWLRILIYRLFGIETHSRRINPKCFIGGSKLHVGYRTFISYGNFFDLTDSIYIGNDVRVAMRSTFITSTHLIAGSSQRAGEGESAPIRIEDGCWIGACATILPGVIVGKGTIIAAGAVVTKNCDPNAIYAGVPARKIRDLADIGM